MSARPTSFRGVQLDWETLFPNLRVLDSYVLGQGGWLFIHRTFDDRFDTSLFDVSTSDDVEGFLREVLSHRTWIPVVVESQSASGLAASARWPVGFEALRATGRPFARILSRWCTPVSIELEGPPQYWGDMNRIVHGEFISSPETATVASG